MTIFKSKKDGKLYIIHQNYNNDNITHTAVPYRHDGNVQRGIDPKDFTIHEKIGFNTQGFL